MMKKANMNEMDAQQLARSFISTIDTSNIRNDLSPYLVAANASLKKEELDAVSQVIQSPNLTEGT